MLIYEANHLIESSTDADVKRLGDGDALSDRITEWLATPQGTVADNPSWGHNLNGFKFDPQSPNMEVEIEMAIVQKITQDIKDLVFLGVGVEFLDIDYFKVVIRHQFGDTVSQKQL